MAIRVATNRGSLAGSAARDAERSLPAGGFQRIAGGSAAKLAAERAQGKPVPTVDGGRIAVRGVGGRMVTLAEMQAASRDPSMRHDIEMSLPGQVGGRSAVGMDVAVEQREAVGKAAQQAAYPEAEPVMAQRDHGKLNATAVSFQQMWRKIFK